MFGQTRTPTMCLVSRQVVGVLECVKFERLLDFGLEL